MTRDRHALPQLGESGFLTDGGLESTLMRQDGWDLPCLAAFELLSTQKGTSALDAYYRQYLEIARIRRLGFILQAPTWRANPDWIARLARPDAFLEEANVHAIAFLGSLRDAVEAAGIPVVVSGTVGPRAETYRVQHVMATAEAQRYHARQVDAFARAGADMVLAMTMTNVPESVGVVRAAVSADLPIAVSFTVGSDGRLPSGDALDRAIAAVDVATDEAPAYYLVHCGIPIEFEEQWDAAIRTGRIRGLRCGVGGSLTPTALAGEYRRLRAKAPGLSILGGCRGADHRHIDAIAEACFG